MAQVNISDVKKQITEIDNLILKLENEKEKLFEQKNELEKLIRKKYTTYNTFNFFPDEFQKLAIYKPSEYRIYCGDSEKCNSYYLKYDQYKFHITDRPDEHYPYTFDVSVKSDNNKWIVLSFTDSQYESNVPFIVKLFYRYPVKITSADSLHYGYLIDLESVIDRAKNLFGDNWKYELSFGIIVFYYWVKIYYQNEKNKSLEDVFEKDSGDNQP
ncbi:putative orfan [Tupanvirus soda lake]|uniref:Orfan n=2 Tax=Tupanvirus TaxID=2094720 RepID=A0AC62AAI1_9VIRU|nr:putative orfan [Tupanvirus soda lake]QKU34786.1 putative orfan [Tupanvirus soda lake]